MSAADAEVAIVAVDWLEKRRSPGAVRDEEHVRVERLSADDRTLYYRKRFFGVLDDNGWLGRENRILLWFSLQQQYPRHLVRLKRVNFLPGGQLNVLDTYDAGPSVKEWNEVPCAPDSSHRLFDRCASWWRLADTSLAALDELHEYGFVHGDVKEDNVCIPFDTRQIQQGKVAIHFDQLRLIDVTYSILPDVPLHRPLPLRAIDGSYQSKLLHQAIEADNTSGRPVQANRLDWKIDLFSLGSMLERLLNRADEASSWSRHNRDAATDLIRRLKAFDECSEVAIRPHAQLRALAHRVLATLPNADPIVTLETDSRPGPKQTLPPSDISVGSSTENTLPPPALPKPDWWPAIMSPFLGRWETFLLLGGIIALIIILSLVLR